MWSELEQAFFDAAPPDEPAAASVRLDDSLLDDLPLDDLSLTVGRPPHDRLARLRVRSLAALVAARASFQRLVEELRAAPWFATLTRARLNRRAVTIGLASAIVLMALSAGVVASRSGAGANAPAIAAAVLTAASAESPPASDLVHRRASATARPHHRVAKHPGVRASAATQAHHKQSKAASGHLAR